MFLVDASQGKDHAQALAALVAQPRELIISVWCPIIGSCERPQVSGGYVGTPTWQGTDRLKYPYGTLLPYFVLVPDGLHDYPCTYPFEPS